MAVRISRRRFLAGCGTVLAGLRASASGSPRTMPRRGTGKKGFFRVRRRGGYWLFMDPDGKPFFSIGINHIDSATLRYRENIEIWRERYDNSMRRWLTERVKPDLVSWGFNTVGWVQEVVTRGPTNHRHSRNFTFEEYQWLDMPYCHMLPFADFHQWEAETKHPDLFSKDFEDWCDYVARSHCARFSDDPKLIGYFYIDCPTWVHTRQESKWKGSLFDPKDLENEAGRRRLAEMAGRYYKVTHDAIRRYDTNHLILGDRYEAAAPLPVEVIEAAAPYIDVVSFQHFAPPENIVANLATWRGRFDLPMLVADCSHTVRLPNGYAGHDINRYRKIMQLLSKDPSCLGYHLCGAYIANRVRKKGLRDERDEVDPDLIEGITKANSEIQQWVRQLETW